MTAYRALVVQKQGDDHHSTIRHLDSEAFMERQPEGADVTLRVLYSTLNYKDGLAMNGLGKVVKSYPHIPGVDLVGEVIESDSREWHPGDVAICTAFRVGEIHWGGYAEIVRLRSDWLIGLPDGLTARDTMIIGTAGLTAMEAVIRLEENHLNPDKGPIIVTGASGGVGSVAVAILAKLGYQVAASTGKGNSATANYLTMLGAKELIDRQRFSSPPEKPLLSRRWAGAIDTVGGDTLARVLAEIQEGGSVASTGLVGGSNLNTTVMPFIIRGVSLLGIDATMLPIERRRVAWQRLAKDLPPAVLETMTTEVTLDEIPQLGQDILVGKITGRTVIRVAEAMEKHDTQSSQPRS